MPKYLKAENGEESSYESDGESHYTPDKHLGRGCYSDVRLFVSKPTGKLKAVLMPRNPGNVDFKEAINKRQFFQQTCPDEHSELIVSDTTYRIVLPAIPGISYSDFLANSPPLTLLQQLNFLGSAIYALKKAHAAGRVVLDFHEGNIHYHLKTGESFLVDGGLSCPIGEKIDSISFRKKDKAACLAATEKYPQIAPECWFLEEETMTATLKMDSYSLGTTIKRLIKDFSFSDVFQPLLLPCVSTDPNVRPTLDQLEQQLNELTTTFYPAFQPFLLAARRFPLTKGPIAAIICALPETLRNRLVIAEADTDVQIMSKLVLLVTEDENASNEENEALAFIAASMNYAEALSDMYDLDLPLSEMYGAKTLAHVAAKEGHVEVIDMLMSLGIDLYEKDKAGNLPIFVAAEEGHGAIIHEFITQDHKVKIKNADGETIVHVAARKGHVNLIDIFVSAGVDLNVASHDGITPIFLAVQKNHTGMLDKLVKYGVPLDGLNAKGKSLAEVAMEAGHSAIIVRLNQLGVDFKKPFSSGRLAVCMAAQKGNLFLLTYFRKCGFDLNAIEQQLGGTPLFYAIRNNQVTCTTYLLSQLNTLKPFMTTQTRLTAFAASLKPELVAKMEDLIKVKLTAGESPLNMSLMPRELAQFLENDKMMAAFDAYETKSQPKDEKKHRSKRKLSQSDVRLFKESEHDEQVSAAAGGKPPRTPRTGIKLRQDRASGSHSTVTDLAKFLG